MNSPTGPQQKQHLLRLSSSSSFIHHTSRLSIIDQTEEHRATTTIAVAAGVGRRFTNEKESEWMEQMVMGSDHLAKIYPSNKLNLSVTTRPLYPSLSLSKECNLMSLIWKHIDPRKPNRQRKLVERTHHKLTTTTSRQVFQILTFNTLLGTLNKYSKTLKRFQDNSSKLHRCLIKWDELKSKDQFFTRRSVLLSLDLQRFIEQMTEYFGTQDEFEEERSSDGALSDMMSVHNADDEIDGVQDSNSITDEGFIAINRPDPLHDHTSRTRSHLEAIGFHRHILIKYKLGQLRFKTKKFNQKFETHETKKINLKVKGNQCIFEMVEDGKKLLELNEKLNQLVFELSLLR